MRENKVHDMASAISAAKDVPKEIREPRARDVRELKGIVHSRRRKPVSLDDMNEAIARGFGGDIKPPR
jgi:hypothetical protein